MSCPSSLNNAANQQPCPSSQPGTPPPDSTSLPNADILCVESNSRTRESLRQTLLSQGFSVHCAASGTEALEYLQCHQPKLVITDLFNEEVNGWDLLVHETLQHPELLVFVISSLPRSATRGAEYLAHAFFEKPLNVRKLVSCAREKLGKTKFIHFPGNDLSEYPIA